MHDPELTAHCANGFDFYVKGKPLTRLAQLRHVLALQDLTVCRRPDQIQETEPFEDGAENADEVREPEADEEDQ